MTSLPPIRPVLSWLAWLLLAPGLCLSCRSTPARSASSTTPITLTVSAAADLTPAFQELGALFEKESGIRVVFNFGSTGHLAEQIKQGAPVDLFAAANRAYIEELAKMQRTIPDTQALYARGRITLWTRADNPRHFARLEDLAPPAVKRIAIANPDHAPYGVAAREALQKAKVWDKVQAKIVPGDNVRQAQQYAETGDVDAALIALSLSVQSKGRWTLIPQEMHAPLDQMLAVIQGTPHEREARAFAAFINGPQGRPIMRKYGFILPNETPD